MNSYSRDVTSLQTSLFTGGNLSGYEFNFCAGFLFNLMSKSNSAKLGGGRFNFDSYIKCLGGHTDARARSTFKAFVSPPPPLISSPNKKTFFFWFLSFCVAGRMGGDDGENKVLATISLIKHNSSSGTAGAELPLQRKYHQNFN